MVSNANLESYEINQTAKALSKEIRGQQAPQINPDQIPQGDIYDVFVMFYEIMQQNKQHMMETTVTGSVLSAGAVHDLGNLNNAFMAWVKDPNNQTSQALIDAYKPIMDFGVDGTDNPAWPLIQKIGAQVGLTSAQQHAILATTAKYGQGILSKVNDALNQLNGIMKSSGTYSVSGFAQLLQGAVNSNNTYNLNEVGATLNAALANPKQPNASMADSEYQNAISGLSSTLSQTATLTSTTLVIENKALEGMINAANTALQATGSGEVRAISSDVNNVSS